MAMLKYTETVMTAIGYEVAPPVLESWLVMGKCLKCATYAMRPVVLVLKSVSWRRASQAGF